MIKNKIAITLAAAMLATAGAAAHAAYPDKPVTMIVGFSPGGFTDVVARLISRHLEARLGQTFVVENKPGAAGTIAADLVVRAKPDGYTLLMGHSNSNATAPALYKNLPYDVNKDFTPIAMVASTPLILTVTPKLGVKNMDEFMALARKGGLRYASSGVGSSQHLAAAQFAKAADVKLLHIPYKGSAQALNDLLSGEVDMNVDSPPLMVPNIKASKLIGIAVVSPSRIPLLPDVPTMKEVGYPAVTMGQWFGVLGPAGMPAEVTTQLNKEINEILKLPEVEKVLADKGAAAGGGSASAFATQIREDTVAIQKVVDEAGIKIE
ncbi:tripartite tricarboxylate transporter substrate binding protein [Pusillimonas sp. TS35]|uniref:Bug family tripartite tricarboxylate transporter substrate binding protein n=1 Tax=Paracandidimonas lactea TaxID=2895524 RepID=UPI0013712CDD|nr:tripartite tricarboxylate transporter substrate binding protein [Paracandidimonas lactea]MYN13552.1 tripartite tricarboxylate transporter substrate binding protein [Pusillimonas sp. TS35]